MAKRKTPKLAPGWHRVTLNYNAWMVYFQSQRDGSPNKHDQVEAWLKANVTNHHWVFQGYYGGSVFDLKNESDALMFQLVFG